MAAYVGAHAHMHPALQPPLGYVLLQGCTQGRPQHPTPLVPGAMTAHEQEQLVRDVLLHRLKCSGAPLQAW